MPSQTYIQMYLDAGEIASTYFDREKSLVNWVSRRDSILNCMCIVEINNYNKNK